MLTNTGIETGGAGLGAQQPVCHEDVDSGNDKSREGRGRPYKHFEGAVRGAAPAIISWFHRGGSKPLVYGRALGKGCGGAVRGEWQLLEGGAGGRFLEGSVGPSHGVETPQFRT